MNTGGGLDGENACLTGALPGTPWKKRKLGRVHAGMIDARQANAVCARRQTNTFAVQSQGRFSLSAETRVEARAPRDGHAERLKPAVALPQAATGLGGNTVLCWAKRAARAGAAAAALCPRSAYLPLATARRGGPRPRRRLRLPLRSEGGLRDGPWLTRFGVRDWRWKNTLDTATNSCTAER